MTAASAHLTAAPRVGFFGRLASGNMGNDVSLEAVLGYLRTEHQDAVLDAMCNGPGQLKHRYGMDATQLFWQAPVGPVRSKLLTAAVLAVEKAVDTVRIMSWVRHHDAVIVPGMGVLEATLPLRPWETPYSLFVLGLSGRLFRTRIALVSVGASPAARPATRWLQNWTARLASYVSYRDAYSRDAMERRGVAASGSRLYPDLVFGLPLPGYDPGRDRTVGIGVMAYGGGDRDRDRAAEIGAAYRTAMKQFAGWLVDHGNRVILFTGDADDQPVADEILAYLRQSRPDLGDRDAVIAPATSFAELTEVMQQASAVVVTRFHNLVCALRLGKPAISLSYGAKSSNLMADAGLADFSLSPSLVDGAQLIERFGELRAQAAALIPAVRASTAAKARLLDEQYECLSAELLT